MSDVQPTTVGKTLATRAVGMETEQAIADQALQAQIDIPREKLEEITQWLYEEITEAKNDRTLLDKRLLLWEQLYEARPEYETKTEPWEGACNLVIPVIATAVDAVLARLLNVVFGGKRLWLPVAKAKGWVDSVPTIELWLDWCQREVLKMYNVCQRWFLSLTKYGTGILKLPWVQRFRNVHYRDQDGREVKDRIVIHNGPMPENVPLTHFLFSSDAIMEEGIQYCSWVDHRTIQTKKELKEKEVSNIYTNVDEVLKYTGQTTEEIDDQQEETTGVQPVIKKTRDIHEVWASYDVDGDGFLEEIVVDMHLETKTVVRAVYNFYRHQERPFHMVRYMPRDNNLLGIGLCQMLADIQEEITTIHRQRIDNATIANTRAWLRRRGSTLGTEEIYPGAFVDVDEPDDIQELKLGDIYPSLLQEELHTNAIGEKRTGVSDYTVGRESQAIGSRATATSTLALIREGNKRFQMTIRDIRERLNDIAHQVIMLYQQFAPHQEVTYEMFDKEERRWMQQLLQLPVEYSRASVVIDTPAISEVYNKEIVQQTMLTLMGVVQQFYNGIAQAFMVATAPTAPEPLKALAAQGAQAGAKIWEKVLEAFDIRDAETYVPDVEGMLGFSQAAETLQQLGGQGGRLGTTGEAGGEAGTLGQSLIERTLGLGGERAGTPEGERAAQLVGR